MQVIVPFGLYIDVLPFLNNLIVTHDFNRTAQSQRPRLKDQVYVKVALFVLCKRSFVVF